MEGRIYADPSLMVTRRWTVEHPFGTIKRISGGGRFLTRGLRAVKGRIAIRYKGEDLAYRTFDKIRKINQVAAVENKRLGSQLEMIRTHQKTQPQEERRRKAPK